MIFKKSLLNVYFGFCLEQYIRIYPRQHFPKSSFTLVSSLSTVQTSLLYEQSPHVTVIRLRVFPLHYLVYEICQKRLCDIYLRFSLTSVQHSTWHISSQQLIIVSLRLALKLSFRKDFPDLSHYPDHLEIQISVLQFSRSETRKPVFSKSSQMKTDITSEENLEITSKILYRLIL